jgi:hypothetical protein
MATRKTAARTSFSGIAAVTNAIAGIHGLRMRILKAVCLAVGIGMMIGWAWTTTHRTPTEIRITTHIGLTIGTTGPAECRVAVRIITAITTMTTIGTLGIHTLIGGTLGTRTIAALMIGTTETPTMIGRMIGVIPIATGTMIGIVATLTTVGQTMTIIATAIPTTTVGIAIAIITTATTIEIHRMIGTTAGIAATPIRITIAWCRIGICGICAGTITEMIAIPIAAIQIVSPTIVIIGTITGIVGMMTVTTTVETMIIATMIRAIGTLWIAPTTVKAATILTIVILAGLLMTTVGTAETTRIRTILVGATTTIGIIGTMMTIGTAAGMIERRVVATTNPVIGHRTVTVAT